jgi:NADH-quinone oxidoreductase subunit D
MGTLNIEHRTSNIERTEIRVRPPSFINLTVLEDMCLGHRIADTVVILGSVDIVLGEVDR